jgi:circadian clock protein KaiC
LRGSTRCWPWVSGGSSILLTGTPGTARPASPPFAQAAARRGERVLFFSPEESPNQIIRNMH